MHSSFALNVWKRRKNVPYIRLDFVHIDLTKVSSDKEKTERLFLVRLGAIIRIYGKESSTIHRVQKERLRRSFCTLCIVPFLRYRNRF